MYLKKLRFFLCLLLIINQVILFPVARNNNIPIIENRIIIIDQDTDLLWNLDLLNMSSVWDITKGDPDITVAVLDSAIQFSHTELIGTEWTNSDEIENNGIDDDNNGYIDDKMGWDFVDHDNNPTDGLFLNHGTHISGIIVAAHDDENNIYGIAPEVKIMPLRVLNDNDVAQWIDIADGIQYAIDNGADVISLSIVGSSTFGVYDAIEDALENNIPVVIAAGNTASNTTENYFPSLNSVPDNALIIGNIDSDQQIYFESNHGKHIDLVAPGTSIVSTISLNRSGLMTGTSMSTPHVSATIALLKSLQPDLTVDTINNMLKKTAIDLGPLGYDQYYGYGMVNPLSVLRVAQDTIGPDLTINVMEGAYENNLAIQITNKLHDNLFLDDITTSVVSNDDTIHLERTTDLSHSNSSVVEIFDTGVERSRSLYPITITVQLNDLNGNNVVITEVLNQILYKYGLTIVLSLLATIITLVILMRYKKSKSTLSEV